jgi:hypothetical protein
LLNARVIPDLEEEGFYTLPIARVSNDPPPEVDREAIANIFIFSTLLALADPETPVADLTQHTLCSFLQTYHDLGKTPAVTDETVAVSTENLAGDEDAEDALGVPLPILIWDQFEELFTTHQDRWQEAEGFFLQVREALDTIPELGVTFVMREDHVAAVEPYAPLMPRWLRARFRMERLGYEGALAAVKQPAAQAGYPFDEGIAERLVDNLRRIRAQRHAAVDDKPPLGPYVEPVQLQVVCSRLWDNLPEQKDKAASAANLIQWTEVEQFGGIDQALTDFYEEAIAQACAHADVSERQVRRWFGQQLITPMETRGLVLRGEDSTGGCTGEPTYRPCGEPRGRALV